MLPVLFFGEPKPIPKDNVSTWFLGCLMIVFLPGVLSTAGDRSTDPAVISPKAPIECTISQEADSEALR